MEKLEEVLGSSMCEYSSIEKRLAILYRNQVKIYDAITKEQKGYSKEEEKFKECYFIASTKTSSATICENCGKEKFLHKI